MNKLDAIHNYNDESIQVLEGLEAVRKRPAMYIGNTNSGGLAHLVFEIFDNSVDEVLSDFATTIELTFLSDGSVEIIDDGRGIPPKSVETIFTTLHAGGKFNSDSYKSSGGLHGVGTSVTNAMSSWLETTVYRDGKEYFIRFENGGHPVAPIKVIGKCDKSKSGTKVRFLPDSSLFSTSVFNIDRIEQRIRETAFLNTNVKITFNDFRDEENKETKVFDYNGMKDYLAYLASGSSVIVTPQESNYFDDETGIEVTLAYQWVENDSNSSENILSYVNNIRTRDGGTHETGFKVGLTKAFNQYGKDTGLLKGKYNKVLGEDIRDGMIAVISVKIPENILEFESQTKDKLGSIVARSVLDSCTNDVFTKFLSQNKSDAEYLIDRAIKYQKMKDEARRLKETTKKTNNKNKKFIDAEKLSEPNNKNSPYKWELFMVEGNSAAGSAKLARFKEFQGILSLRGKVLNTENVKYEEAMKNLELNLLMNALGCGHGADYSEEDLRYDKLILMTDADVDGSHIQILILTFLFRHCRKLIENGHVYIAQPPLYKITARGKSGKQDIVEYAWNTEELRKKSEKYTKPNITRFKGLGEMNDIDLHKTTMNLDNRSLYQVSVEDFVQASTITSLLMDKNNSDKRKVWINKNVKFNDAPSEE